MRNLKLIILILLGIVFQATAQTSKKSWKNFAGNDFPEAAVSFQNDIKLRKNTSDAFLGLALTKDIQEHSQQAFDAFKSFYELSENPEPYLYALWNSDLNLNNAEISFYEELLISSKLNPTNKALIQEKLAQYFESKRQFAKAKENQLGVNAVSNWSFLGPFENISKSGFNKYFGVV